MSTATFTDRDLRKIVELAILISEDCMDEATLDDVQDIVDGDEAIVTIINNLAKLYFLTWITLEDGIKSLRKEMLLDGVIVKKSISEWFQQSSCIGSLAFLYADYLNFCSAQQIEPDDLESFAIQTARRKEFTKTHK